MSEVTFKKHRVFRETEAVVFYDISVDGSNAQDLVCHTGAAISPPDDIVGAKQFYIHYHQIDHNRVLSGLRTFDTGKSRVALPISYRTLESFFWCSGHS